MSEANNGITEVSAADLLNEETTGDDCREVERVMGRFNSTTGFLSALLIVLMDLEADQEAETLRKFLPIMAEAEAQDMKGDLSLESFREAETRPDIPRTIPPKVDAHLIDKAAFDSLSYEDRFNIATQLIDG